jgi:hypothetical protein
MRTNPASWDDPSGKGGITTKGGDLRELQDMVLDAVTGYFNAAGVPAPSRVRLHFVTDPELAVAENNPRIFTARTP